MEGHSRRTLTSEARLWPDAPIVKASTGAELAGCSDALMPHKFSPSVTTRHTSSYFTIILVHFCPSTLRRESRSPSTWTPVHPTTSSMLWPIYRTVQPSHPSRSFGSSWASVAGELSAPSLPSSNISRHPHTIHIPSDYFPGQQGIRPFLMSSRPTGNSGCPFPGRRSGRITSRTTHAHMSHTPRGIAIR